MRNMLANILSRSYRGVRRTGLSRKPKLVFIYLRGGVFVCVQTKSIFVGYNFFPYRCQIKSEDTIKVFSFNRVVFKSKYENFTRTRSMDGNIMCCSFCCCFFFFSFFIRFFFSTPSSICTIPSLHIRKQETGNLKHTPPKPLKQPSELLYLHKIHAPHHQRHLLDFFVLENVVLLSDTARKKSFCKQKKITFMPCAWELNLFSLSRNLST